MFCLQFGRGSRLRADSVFQRGPPDRAGGAQIRELHCQAGMIYLTSISIQRGAPGFPMRRTCVIYTSRINARGSYPPAPFPLDGRGSYLGAPDDTFGPGDEGVCSLITGTVSPPHWPPLAEEDDGFEGRATHCSGAAAGK